MSAGFTFWHFLLDLLTIFLFVMWIWLLITIYADLFRRHDVSGFGKVVWVILLLLLPFLGAFIYLLTQGGGMAERQQARTMEAREEMRKFVGYSTADELEKLAKLKADGTITEAEYSRLRARLM
ncbi:SHOCT domain-containing protein [Amaricoccus solimangrovi]|uniref:SHOCT domain-containing protein n=1 Tax=Amaricoccus solimangrovi TaxID=2589815 RepID=A0A501WEQ4_9RHOB|nr:SHOCT domain-containing protein [Amaricoccus solimangrovi]TPE46554.1 SHOCT domain-containing protein [Amaricoccus solimangrovi]